MKALTGACMVAAMLAASAAAADAGEGVRGQSLEVKERLRDLEQIEVTSHKPSDPDAAPLDAELQGILDAATRAERSRRAPQREREGSTASE